MARVDKATASLEIRNGEFAGMVYELLAEETRIGRNPTTDITLLDAGISREHAVVISEPFDGGHRLEDLDSTNGTKVNGKSVLAATLNDGDEIEMGQTCFRYVRNPTVSGGRNDDA